MNLFAPNTGDAKMDKAYLNMQEHISKCKTFDDFLMHFKYIVKTDDAQKLNEWLLKVLFVNMKHDKHDFDRLLESVDATKRQELTTWLQTNLDNQTRTNK